jgi:hypothetical protein
VLRRRRADRIANRIVGTCADHQDRARIVAGADKDVTGIERAVEIVPLPQPALLFLDNQHAFPGQDEEALLHTLAKLAPPPPASSASRSRGRTTLRMSLRGSPTSPAAPSESSPSESTTDAQPTRHAMAGNSCNARSAGSWLVNRLICAAEYELNHRNHHLQVFCVRRLGHGIGPRSRFLHLNRQQEVPFCRHFNRRERRDSEPATSGVTGRSWCLRAERG